MILRKQCSNNKVVQQTHRNYQKTFRAEAIIQMKSSVESLKNRLDHEEE